MNKQEILEKLVLAEGDFGAKHFEKAGKLVSGIIDALSKEGVKIYK